MLVIKVYLSRPYWEIELINEIKMVKTLNECSCCGLLNYTSLHVSILKTANNSKYDAMTGRNENLTHQP